MKLFAHLSLDSAIPDRTTIMNFRHLLEKHKLAREILKAVNRWLSECGILMKLQGTLLDATIIEAPSSTKNKDKQRDHNGGPPEMHQAKKGDQWFYGMKAHIGVDAKSGMTNTFKTTSANEHDLNKLSHLLHGEEEFVSADSGYRGAEKREELKDTDVDWLIAERPCKVRSLKKQPRKNKRAIKIEFLKASIAPR